MEPIRKVLPVGSLNAPICIIGEAPGASEVIEGKPFVGRSGQLLDKLLNQAGLMRTQCYITNVVKQQPNARNDISVFIKARTNGKIVTAPEYDLYEHDLYEELQSVYPRIIICLGNVALYALTRKWGISRWRGSVLEATVGNRKFKVIPTYHPSSALRDMTMAYPLALDLKRVASEQHIVGVHYPERQLLIKPSYEQCMGFLSGALSLRSVACDIETSNGQVHCISFCSAPDTGISIPFVAQDGSDYFSPPQELAIWRAIAAILESPTITKVFQNAMFDTFFMLERYGIRTWPVDDTMVGQHIVAPDLPKGLDFITSVYTREPYYKDEGKTYNHITGDILGFWLYNAKDSAVTMEAMPQIRNELLRQLNIDTYKRTIDVLQPLLFMQKHGMPVDTMALRSASVDAGEELERLHRELVTLVGHEINHGSVLQLKKFFYEELGEKPIHNRKTGQVSTDEEALKKLKVRGGTASKPAELMMRIREVEKLKNTYLDVKLDDDGRLRGSFNPVGTSTGRLSSRQTLFGTGANLQNLPSVFDVFIIADDGCVMYKKDLSQAENRIVAYVGPEPNMIRAFETGRDVHCSTAALLFARDYDELLAGCAEKLPEFLSIRAKGKACNHSLNYDMGPRTFAGKYEMREADAKLLVAAYHHAYPNVRRGYQQQIKDALQSNMTVMNLMGRRRKFYGQWGDELFKAAYAHLAQSTVGDKINESGLNYIYYNQDQFHDVILLNQIHDAILFAIPVSAGWGYHARCLKAIDASMSSPLSWHGRSFSIPSDTKMGLNVGDVKHHKDGTTSNNAGMRNVNLNQSDELVAGQLEAEYTRMRAASQACHTGA